ncbi:MAG TPA: aminotransferase class I/II-fold pyridoxal phosphate-dependent enzyme [Polyangiaceae bacterium]|nr:aminotransferase class I/II-fold pyridoxal phosphate-dependent enzyme [Polyangiaceae bacterium]
MHLIPSHEDRPADDPIFSLHQEATARKGRGESVVDATIGVLLDESGELCILPTAARAVREVETSEWASYAPIAGTPEFRRAVIDDLLGSSADLRASAVAVATPGGSGALRHAVANFLEPGHAALTTSWYWSPYKTLCDESDRRLETFDMFSKSGVLDVGALDTAMARQLASQGRVLLFVNDPAHNPTGYSMSDDDWRSVVDVIAARAARAPVALVVDCAYMLYGPRTAQSLPPLLQPLLGSAAVLFAWSASKSYTHYGLRVGALVACIGDARERAMVESALSYSCRGTWSNCNRGGQAAITRLLCDRRLADACSSERAALRATLSARVDAFNDLGPQRGLSYPRYDGGFFVTVFDGSPKEKAASMREKGVYVVPQAIAGRGGALRVALCAVALRDVPRLVEALATA